MTTTTTTHSSPSESNDNETLATMESSSLCSASQRKQASVATKKKNKQIHCSPRQEEETPDDSVSGEYQDEESGLAAFALSVREAHPKLSPGDNDEFSNLPLIALSILVMIGIVLAILTAVLGRDTTTTT